MNTIKAFVDDLHDLGLTPLHLHIDGPTPIRAMPDIRLWLRTRTDFEAYCARHKLKAVPSRYNPEGQRSWSATRDTDELRLLVQCVSFRHHNDWQETPR